MNLEDFRGKSFECGAELFWMINCNLSGRRGDARDAVSAFLKKKLGKKLPEKKIKSITYSLE